ncbi:hypothetical protein ACGFWI_37850 [Streptomyces sp. NPDC048434]|uniref:hypothetical protein n=1 Tax=Streptomyces sp. NPDC048434 TaxID=3365549 RepID=UPI003714AF4B
MNAVPPPPSELPTVHLPEQSAPPVAPERVTVTVTEPVVFTAPGELLEEVRRDEERQERERRGERVRLIKRPRPLMEPAAEPEATLDESDPEPAAEPQPEPVSEPAAESEPEATGWWATARDRFAAAAAEGEPDPDWWARPEVKGEDLAAPPGGGCQHEHTTPVRLEGGGVAGHLCVTCDARLPAALPAAFTKRQKAAFAKECEHLDPTPLVAQATGQTVGYLCRDCDTQLPADHVPRVPILAPMPGYYTAPAAAVAGRIDDHVQAALSSGTRAALNAAAAAGIGWLTGLVPLFRGWIEDCGRTAGPTAALMVGVGLVVLVMHVWDRRTRHWWWGLAWVARIPLMSAVLALGLYAPGTF